MEDLANEAKTMEPADRSLRHRIHLFCEGDGSLPYVKTQKIKDHNRLFASTQQEIFKKIKDQSSDPLSSHSLQSRSSSSLLSV